MIEALVEYACDEKKVIDNLMSSTGFCNKSWGNDELKGIRKKIKDFYKEEQGFTCPYCQIHMPVKHGMAWDIEHIIPLESNPKFMFEALNLCVSCKDCNIHKSNKPVLYSKKANFPIESEHYKIVHPHFDDYGTHILVIAVGDLYKPITKKGEDTIGICKLYRFYHKVNRAIPMDSVKGLAKAILATDGIARELIEDKIVEQIQMSRKVSGS